MKKASVVRTWVLDGTTHQEAPCTLYAGMDLSRQRLDVHVLDEEGRTVEATAVRPDADAEIAACERDLRAQGADHPYVPLLMSAPGIAWVLGYTIAAEIGDVGRFASPKGLWGLERETGSEPETFCFA